MPQSPSYHSEWTNQWGQAKSAAEDAQAARYVHWGATSQDAMDTGLALDPDRMRANLEATHGQILAEAVTMALGSRIGRLVGHELVEHACHRAAATRRHLGAVLAKNPAVTAHPSRADLDRLLE